MTALALLLGTNGLFAFVGKIFHPLFVAVADVLAFIYGIIPNYAVAIILLTIIIMALLTPLTIKSTKSMIAMQTLQPEMQKLRQKYKGSENREQLNQEMMKLYKEQGVSPTGGCLPMFLQMPALIVLYDVIKGLTNTITHGMKYPAGTYPPGTHAGQVCHQAVCAIPRYIPTSSKMYHDLVASHGAMPAFGINLALKPFSPHGAWYNYIPYFVLVVLAVGLQYIQMSQMTKRNPAAAKANPQMQKMQKIMPLIFAYIYFIIPAGVVLYMIVSTGIRIGTQDFIFRSGIVQRPAEREIGGGAKKVGPAQVAGAAALVEGGKKPAGKGGNGKPPPAKAEDPPKKAGPAGSVKKPAAKPAPKPTNGNGKGASGGTKGTGGTKAAAGAKNSGGTDGGDTAEDDTGADDGSTKAHPRSKSKRSRKAR